MRSILISLAGAAALFVLTAAAGDMTVATFLTKAEALQKKGPLALMSPDLKVLKAEMKGVSTAYRSRLESDRKSGATPHSCPPAKASMNSKELLDHLKSYPETQRNSISIRSAFFELMKKRYPCPA